MSILRSVVVAATAALVGGCHMPGAAGAVAPAGLEATLRAAETAKWHPAAIGRDSAQSLFADDMLTVEYGADPMGLVYRSTVDRAVVGQLYDILNATTFSLSEWRVVRLAPDAMLVSYRITTPATNWTAYATSTWVRRGSRWQTVFYQASRAKPAR